MIFVGKLYGAPLLRTIYPGCVKCPRFTLSILSALPI
jgi:hypothetical protein